MWRENYSGLWIVKTDGRSPFSSAPIGVRQIVSWVQETELTYSDSENNIGENAAAMKHKRRSSVRRSVCRQKLCNTVNVVDCLLAAPLCVNVGIGCQNVIANRAAADANPRRLWDWRAPVASCFDHHLCWRYVINQSAPMLLLWSYRLDAAVFVRQHNH